MIETIQWTDEGVVMIDQTRLPNEEIYVTCRNYHEVADAIRTMIIRGAPAIGVAAAMGFAIGVVHADSANLDAEVEAISKELAGTQKAQDCTRRVVTAGRIVDRVPLEIAR